MTTAEKKELEEFKANPQDFIFSKLFKLIKKAEKMQKRQELLTELKITYYGNQNHLHHKQHGNN